MRNKKNLFKFKHSKGRRRIAFHEAGHAVVDVILHAESRLGELLRRIVEPRGKKIKGGSSQGTTLRSLPSGINKKQSFYAQQLASNQEMIEEVIDRAFDVGKIPRREDVIRAINKKKRSTAQDELIKREYLPYAEVVALMNVPVNSANEGGTE